MNIKERACRLLYAVIKARCPIDTANLVTHGITMESNFSAIYIGNEVADYAVYTNEPWIRGKNPNEGWIPNAIEEAMPMIKSMCSGEMSNEEYLNLVQDYEKMFTERMQERATQFEEEI